MLSTMDLERLIAEKRLEIEKEKIFLGLSSPQMSGNVENEKQVQPKPARQVSFPPADLREYNASAAEKAEENEHAQELDGEIPPALDRYIRRYLGLPIMLKAGEFSPNNPLLAREFTSGDALLGLGEYERRRRALRPLRQRQYKEYLDQQAKKKQEAKEQAERERREREEKEREREERERERELQERERLERERRIRVERRSPERRRASENYVESVGTFSYSNKVDTGVQVDSVTSPLSVAVQTDDAELFRLPSPCKSQLTQAERELSPHTVAPTDRPAQAAWYDWRAERRRSYGDFDERSLTLDKKALAKRNAYMPSFFDADAVHQRNLQAEKEAAARRQFYQQELKNQIMEQQRIREERKTREKMLEQAEMRRLEEQLRMLRVAQEREIDKQHHIDNTIKEDNMDYEKRRKQFQKEMEEEQHKLVHAPTFASQLTSLPKPFTSRSESNKLPYYYNYPRVDREMDRQIRPLDKDIHSQRADRTESDRFENRKEKSLFTDDYRSEKNETFENRTEKVIDKSDKKPYSMNIPDDSIFSPNYDVDSYLRKNLNFKDRYEFNRDFDFDNIGKDVEKNIEKVLVHERPKPRPIAKERKKIQQDSMDSLPIPVLRHSPLSQVDKVESSNLSDAMKKVDDKWKVPAVQKNILKSIPNEEGKNVSILTQLGSIRRQLQLEQLKLDGISKDDEV